MRNYEIEKEMMALRSSLQAPSGIMASSSSA